ncbi:hypothetical protein JZ751_025302 [Albula glossodonta]|uniref:Uncharacterized protein n=1 Tax=Albula glossodonta TaxID=121402 RepID=A0A8T2NMK6_9TELE|nr:hypothetical protein JZ751_025302 [Albula glossodonta]
MLSTAHPSGSPGHLFKTFPTFLAPSRLVLFPVSCPKPAKIYSYSNSFLVPVYLYEMAFCEKKKTKTGICIFYYSLCKYINAVCKDKSILFYSKVLNIETM